MSAPPDPILAGLGFSPDDRVVVVHADDVGMSEASVSAFAELVDGGLLSSASLMVPCPWFARAAALCRRRPDLDAGVHVTLTSEWEGYRWGPLSTRDPASGLLDEQGCFPRTRQQLHDTARPAAVRREMAAQLDRALDAGVDATHLDSHMFAVFHPDLLPLYVELGRERGLPAIITCDITCDGERPRQWFDSGSEEDAREFVRGCRALGLPLPAECMLVLGEDEDPLARAKRAFDELAPGLTYMIIHPARDTPELRAMTPSWRHRVGEYETFMNPGLRRHVEESGVKVIGCRPLREAFRRRAEEEKEDVQA
jgi:chitin disaccharide deacetylase